MAFPFDIVGFDLDGTLVDTKADLAAAVAHALALEQRPPLAPESIEAMIGGGGRRMFRLALEASGGAVADARFETLYAAMIAYYAAHIADRSLPFAGVEVALDTLAGLGVRLAVVTNKREALAVKLLTALGMIERFVTVIGGDSLGPGTAKPSPVPILTMIERLGGGRAAFVGDSIHDAAAARAAQLPFVAVSFGYRDRPVEALGADAVIDDYAALVGLLALV